jgi:hypothetical protein
MFAPGELSQGINTLVLVQLRWPVLKCPPMAGFQMSTEVNSLQGVTEVFSLLVRAFLGVPLRG